MSVDENSPHMTEGRPQSPTGQSGHSPQSQKKNAAKNSRSWKILNSPLVVALIAFALGFIPYLYTVTISGVATRGQVKTETEQVDREIATRLAAVARSLKQKRTEEAPSILQFGKLFLNEPNLADSTAWMYGDLTHKSLGDLVFKLITLERDKSKLSELKAAQSSIITCEVNFRRALSTSEPQEYIASNITNADGTEIVTGPTSSFVTGTDGRVYTAVGLGVISPQELTSLNLPRWGSPFTDILNGPSPSN
jgi:hypothetical protein